MYELLILCLINILICQICYYLVIVIIFVCVQCSLINNIQNCHLSYIITEWSNGLRTNSYHEISHVLWLGVHPNAIWALIEEKKETKIRRYHCQIPQSSGVLLSMQPWNQDLPSTRVSSLLAEYRKLRRQVVSGRTPHAALLSLFIGLTGEQRRQWAHFLPGKWD